MSEKKDDESSAIAVAFGFLGVFAMVFMMIFLAFLAFVAFLLTIASLFAWNKPRRYGKFVVTPEEARAFVYRGLIGIVALPAFAIFCAALFNLDLDWDAIMPYLLLAGYVGGSLGIEILFADSEQSAPPPAPYVPPQPQIPDARRALPRPVNQEKGFHYASWDDEEDQE